MKPSLFLLLLLAGCAAPAPATEPSAPKAATVSTAMNAAGDRATIKAPGAQTFGLVRPAAVEASHLGAHTVDLVDETTSATFDLPNERGFEGVRLLVVFRIDAGGHYGKVVVHDTHELETAARGDAALGAAVIVKASDDVPLAQLLGVTNALAHAGIKRVILALASAGRPPAPWTACPVLNDVAGAEQGDATLDVTWDDEGLMATMRVASATTPALGAAALACGVRQTTDLAARPKNVRVTFVR